MKDQIHTWKDTVLTIVGIVIVFAIGGYFGYRVQEIKNFDEVTDLQAQVITAETEKQKQQLDPTIPIVPLEVPEVYWLAPGGESVCPATHPIKGKFTATGNIAYGEENKTYKRVNAHICFIDLTYATQKAGFFEKKD